MSENQIPPQDTQVQNTSKITLSTKQAVGAILISLVLGVGVGRITRKTETKTDEKETSHEVTKDKHQDQVTDHKTITTVRVHRDGSKTKTVTTIVEKKKETGSGTQTTDKQDHKTIDVSRSGGAEHGNVSILAGIQTKPGALVYGGQISTTLVGPVTIGGFALTSGTFGASLGINF